MTKTEYQINFSYDLTQTSQVKYDTPLIKACEKIGGGFVSKHEDEYGGREITLNAYTDLTTLNESIKKVLDELSKKNVKMTVTASKVEHIISIDLAQISDFSSFQALTEGWAAERNGRFEHQGNSINVVLGTKAQAKDFVQNVLPQAVIFTPNNKVPDAYVEERNEVVVSKDNYNNKRKSSLAA